MPRIGAPNTSHAGFTGEVPVLGLHGEDPTSVVKTVLRRGFTPIWISELADAIAGRGELPAQPVALTLDDGDPIWYTTSHPVFVAYGFKATLCVTSDYLSQVDLAAFGNTGITWDQARTMNESGLYDWQNHSKTHTTFTALSESALLTELAACNAAIVSELGVAAPKAVIYPHGGYSAAVMNTVRQAGFELAFKFGSTDSDRPVMPGAAPLALNRADDPLNQLLWAKQQVIYDFAHDTTGARNAANVLGYWTLPTGGSLPDGGEKVRLDSTATGSALSAITADYFHATGALYSHLRVTVTGRTAGTAKVSVRQYDGAQGALATIDLASVSANQAGTVYEGRVALDASCQFVRLEVSADAAFDGIVDAIRWVVTTA